MLIPNINAVHEIVPPGFFGGVSNRMLPPEEQIYFRCRGISMPEKEQLDQEKAALSFTSDPKKRLEKNTELDYELAKKKFVSLHNYYTVTDDGSARPVTEFDDFIKVAPPEMVAWYFDVIQYGEKLSAAERRNFLQPSVSPSGSQDGETATNGSAAAATPKPGKPATATT